MAEQTWTLESDGARVTIDGAGRLTHLAGGGREWPLAAGAVGSVTVQAPSSASVLGRQRPAEPVGPPVVTARDGEVRVDYCGLVVEGQPVDIDLSFTLSAAEGEMVARFSLRNRSAVWTVRELRGPSVSVSLDGDPALLWPLGAGERVADPGRIGRRQLAYPTRLFMPWLGLDRGDHGLYFGCHDTSLTTLGLTADATRAAGRVELAVSHYPFCAPGDSWSSPPTVIRPYAGTWHVAGERYRRWAETWRDPVPPPAWVSEATGWQLAILKQQNGEIHWPYADLDALIALGRETGLNVLGLYGWTEGGHDRRYPVYLPDDAMGGEEALRAGIARAHEAGQRVVLYTNGQLLDLQTEWYAEHGPGVAAVSERGEPFGEAWHKYRDAPPKPMAYACQSCDAWQDRLVELARQVHGLGADGIIFDQLGSAHPTFCFSDAHGHDSPATAIGPGLAVGLRRVQEAMAAIDPDFIIMIEHVTDGLNPLVDLTHGCHIGFQPGGGSFPELLRYCLPDLPATQRHPTPVLDRHAANWGCLYGYLAEVEYRYWPDRLYIEHGQRPELGDYERILNPPDIALMRRTDPRTANAYLREVLAFAARHRDLLRGGRFVDTCGFAIDNPRILAKGYLAAEGLGVLLCNPGDATETVTVTAAGWRLAGADSPEGEATPDAPLPAESLRLLRYVRA